MTPKGEKPMSPTQAMTENPIKRALGQGQSIWYDGLVPPKAFEAMIREDGIRGATTNPTIFEKALLAHEYDAEIRALARTQDAPAIYRTLTVRAVREVADVFLPVYEASRGEDGFVSIEVSPLLARDTAATLAEARELWTAVDRPNAMIKVPATREGLPAIRALIAGGINVNVTLIFSIARYREVMEAYLLGLEDRRASGGPLERTASVASFFVSRVDTAVDKLLEGRPESGRLTGTIGIANSKAAYAAFGEVFGSARFRGLEAAGAKVQRPLWASTGTKNPAYSDVLYVEALMGPRTVDTVPPATLDAFRDHGVPGSRLGEGAAQAFRALEELTAAGIDLTSVTADLEAAGVKSFSDSYEKILREIGAKRS